MGLLIIKTSFSLLGEMKIFAFPGSIVQPLSTFIFFFWGGLRNREKRGLLVSSKSIRLGEENIMRKVWGRKWLIKFTGVKSKFPFTAVC